MHYKADIRAELLQSAIRRDERDRVQLYSDDEINQAIIHTREDLVLVVSYLSSANKRLAHIVYILLAISVISIVVAVTSLN